MGGGVGLLIRQDICFQECPQINNIKTEIIEKLAVVITNSHDKYIFVGLYRPPSSKVRQSLADLESILQQLFRIDQPFILGG